MDKTYDIKLTEQEIGAIQGVIKAVNTTVEQAKPWIDLAENINKQFQAQIKPVLVKDNLEQTEE